MVQRYNLDIYIPLLSLSWSYNVLRSVSSTSTGGFSGSFGDAKTALGLDFTNSGMSQNNDNEMMCEVQDPNHKCPLVNMGDFQ